MNEKKENLLLFVIGLTLVILLLIAVFGVSVDIYKDIMEIKSYSETELTESASEEESTESTRCLGEDIYDIDGRELLINNDTLYDIESKFFWYNSTVFGNCKVYDSSRLTATMLERRAGLGVTFVERCIGYVTDGKTGDGMVINANSKNNFISFKGVDLPYKTGTVFVTYLVYADNNYIDDFERYDFVLTRDYEVEK